MRVDNSKSYMSTRSRKIPLNVGVAGGGWNQKKKTGATISFHGEPNNTQFCAHL